MRSRTVPDSSTLLSGPLRRTMFFLALPVLGEQILNFLVGFYDVYLSGHLPGDNQFRTVATSAVGVAAYVGWLASMVFALVASGTTALVARAWGAGDYEQANRVTNRSVAMGALTGFLFLILVLVAAPQMVAMMGLSGEAVDIAARYVRLDGFGLFFSSLAFVIGAAFRGSGDMKTPMLVFAFVSVANVIASTLLVYGHWGLPELGVDGIVTGTVIARSGGGLILLAVFLRGSRGLSLQARELKLWGETVRRILRIGLPAAAEGIIMWLGHVVFLRVISQLGPAEFAAHIIGVRVEGITYLPAVAWGSAAATMVGQSLGAGARERAVQAGHEAALQCVLLGVAITLCFTLQSDAIYALMHQDEAVRRVGGPAFRIVGLFQIPLILSIVYVAALRGAGDTIFPLLITLVSTYLVRIPIGYLCGVTLNMGLLGAWMGMNLDMFLRGLLATIRFSRKKWTKREI